MHVVDCDRDTVKGWKTPCGTADSVHDTPHAVLNTSISELGGRGQFGVKASNCLGLVDEFALAQEHPLMSQRNPEVPNIGQFFPVRWINSKPQFSFAVRRLLPRVRW